MGMDGLSIANTGAVKESTSAELTSKTEQAIQADAAAAGRQVQGLSVNQRVRPKDDDESSNKPKHKQKEDEETFDDGLVQANQEEQEEEGEEELGIDDVENPNKDFYVKLNVKDDIIELYDSATDRLIETISGNELGELVQKLNMASGIFVNKKV